MIILDIIVGTTPSKPLKIEVGKYYKTIGGQKVKIYAVDNGEIDYTIHGAILRDNAWAISSWTISGNYLNSGKEDSRDIVSEWTDEVEFDFKLIPPWYQYIAMDENGRWYAYASKPNIGVMFGYLDCFLSMDVTPLRIPKNFAPKWEGEWKESLTMNPYYKE